MKVISPKNLICPLDNEWLVNNERRLVCPNGHSFDIARQGYINLLPVQNKRSQNPGDSKEMIIARREFLASGVYLPIARFLVEIVEQNIDKTSSTNLLDAGCGEGYYTDYLLRQLSLIESPGELSITGIDISKHAVIAAARRSREITWLVASNRQIPVQENSIDLILCLFGFMSAEGFRRVLKSNGKILMVDPGVEHLKELKDVIYADNRELEADSSFVEPEGYSVASSQRMTFKTGIIDQSKIGNLLLMTPHGFRATSQGKYAAACLQEIDLTVDLVFRVLEVKMPITRDQ